MPARPLADLEARLGHAFTRPELLRAALAHTTYLNEHPTPGVEKITRLAFLGDAVIELAVRAAIMDHFKDEPRGVLSVASDKPVRDAALADVARRIELGEWIDLGHGEARGGGRDKTRILADALEAVAGAIYLDSRDKSAALDLVANLVQPLAHLNVPTPAAVLPGVAPREPRPFGAD